VTSASATQVREAVFEPSTAIGRSELLGRTCTFQKRDLTLNRTDVQNARSGSIFRMAEQTIPYLANPLKLRPLTAFPVATGD